MEAEDRALVRALGGGAAATGEIGATPPPARGPVTTPAPALSLRGVAKRYGALIALDGVSLDIAAGEFVCFLGPSGCGKTTLLRTIAGLERADAGAIALAGEDVARVSARRRNFGIVFQSYSLFPNMTVARNVAYGLECRRWPRADIAARVDEMLALVGLADQARKLPHQLSGGQQQRIALARALAPKPVVLLLDEPLSALDAQVREELRGQIKDLQRALTITTVMVTHDQQEAMEVADRIVVMNAGRIAQSGTAAEIYEHPADGFVAAFLGRMNRLPAALTVDAAPVVGTWLGIRPEHVELAVAPSASRGHGTVDRCVFLGSCTRVAVRVGDERVVVELPGKRTELVPGTAVTLRAPASAIVRLQDAPR